MTACQLMKNIGLRSISKMNLMCRRLIRKKGINWFEKVRSKDFSV